MDEMNTLPALLHQAAGAPAQPGDIAGVCRTCGQTASGARTRASTLRKRGNALKRLAKRDDSRRGVAKKITDDGLVEAWLAADHIGDVVIATGLSNGRIYQRISALRKAGREIPRMDKKI